MTQLGQISFGPLLNSSVGFDDVFRDFDRMLTASKPPNTFPPHNIYKYDNQYVVELATAGYSSSGLDITVEDNTLYVRGVNLDNSDNSVTYIHKGISSKSFTKKIKLLDTIKVRGAEYKDGILRIFMENVIPDEKKPIKIPIEDSLPAPLEKQLLTE